MNACAVEGCHRPAHQRGWCNMHYSRWYRYGDPLITQRERVAGDRRCSLDGCDEPHYGLGYCRRHHTRFVTYGDPLIARTPADDEPLVCVCDQPAPKGGTRWDADVCQNQRCKRPVLDLINRRRPGDHIRRLTPA